jgi:hypothetical protein
MVVNDSDDPASLYGVVIDINENGQPAPGGSYTLKATSSNISVVSDDNILIADAESKVIIKIKPYGIGYTTITLTARSGGSSDSISINYAVSQGGVFESDGTRWHTGNSDASDAIALDNDYMIVGDDEMNKLFIHHRNESGLPVVVFDYSNLLHLEDGEPGSYKEVDVEAVAKSPRTHLLYWFGSMSNNSKFHVKPNRDRIFATAISGRGAGTTISFIGAYEGLREQVIDWGNKYGYRLGSSAASGQDPKAIDGFNAEGAVFAPDSSTLYIGMRAPLVPVSNRTNALIVPVLNFENWFNKGKPSTRPSFGTPVELGLGGRSIRDITRLSNGVYIIIAGSYGESSLYLPGALYKWSGNAKDTAVLLSSFDITLLNAEGIMEVDDANGKLITDRLQLISDDGTNVYYGDGLEAKDLPENNYKKYHSDIVISSEPGVLNK